MRNLASPAPSLSPPPINPSPEPWTSLAGNGIGQIVTAWRETLQSAGLITLTDFFTAQGQPLSKPGLGKRFRARLRVIHLGQEVSVYLKRFHGEKIGDWLKRTFEDGCPHSPAERELSVARALRAANIAAPQPLAWGRSGHGPSAHSFILLSAVEGEPFPNWWRREGSSLPPQKADTWVRPISDTIRNLHTHGWRHRDLYLCHLFVTRHFTEYKCALIDLQRVFRPRFRPERWRVKDLAQLHFSANAEGIPRHAQIRFLHDYFQSKSNPFSDGEKQLIHKILRKSASMTRKQNKAIP